MARIINEELARDTICTCYLFKIDGKLEDVCWTKGAIGMLTEAQEREYCAGKIYLNPTYARWLMEQIKKAKNMCANSDDKAKCVKEVIAEMTSK